MKIKKQLPHHGEKTVATVILSCFYDGIDIGAGLVLWIECFIMLCYN